jgi:hypothetical protein
VFIYVQAQQSRPITELARVKEGKQERIKTRELNNMMK